MPLKKSPSGSARCRRPRNDGRGIRSRWGDDTIPSQTTSWCSRGTNVTFWKVAFQTSLIHDSDHYAAVVTFHARWTFWLTKYPWQHQCFPLWLPPRPHDRLTCNFEALKLTCKKPEPKRRQGNDWISDDTWSIISHRTMLWRTGRLCQTVAYKIQLQIWALLKMDWDTWTSQVGASIEAALAGGAFRNAKQPCFVWCNY